MSMPKPIADFETYLTAALSPAGTEAFIFDTEDDAGNSLDGKTVWVVIDSERCFGTVDAANNKIDLTLRGVDPNDSTTEVVALQVQHEKGAPVRITDAHYLLQVTEMLSGDISLQGVPKLPTARTISTARQVVDKEYADALTVATFSDFATTDAGGLNVNVAAGTLVTDDGTVEYAGNAGVAMTNNATNYVQLTPSGVLSTNTTGWIVGYVPLSKVVTSGGDITSISLNRGLITVPAGDKTITTDFTYGATIAAGNAVYLDTADGKWKLADGDSSATAAGTIGIALDAGVNNDTGKRVQLSGIVDVLSGMTVGYNYVSNTAGAISTTAGTYKKLVGYAISATKLVLINNPTVVQIEGAGSNATTANFNEAMDFFSATNATGAEMETLTDGSNADALHDHDGLATMSISQESYMVTQIDHSDTTRLPVSTTGAGAGTDYLTVKMFTSSGSLNSGATAEQASVVANNAFAWTKNFYFENSFKLSALVTQDIFIGFGVGVVASGDVSQNATSTAHHVGFFVEDGTLYASNANGTTQTRTNISSGLTLTNWNTLKIISTSSSIRFFVNNVLVATHTTNLPTGSTDSGYALGLTTRSAATKELYVGRYARFALQKD